MELKHNESTFNRPEGDRVLDAPYVFFDIEEYAKQLKEEKAWHKNDRNAITVFKTDPVTMVVVGLKAGAVQKDNLVEGILSIQVIEGKIRIETPDGDIELKEKQVVNFHKCIDHSIQALDDSIFLLTNNSFKTEDEKPLEGGHAGIGKDLIA